MSKIALLIGCQYTNYSNQGLMNLLPGCHDDVKLFSKLLKDYYNYTDNEIIILMDDDNDDSDDNSNLQPTKNNIIKYLCKFIDLQTQCIVIYYAGHGIRVVSKNIETTDINENNEEKNLYDECMVPCDYKTQGVITDDTLHDIFWTKLHKEKVSRVSAIFDCCNSGTLFDLPFLYQYPNQLKIATKRTEDIKYSDNHPLIFSISGCKDNQTSSAKEYKEDLKESTYNQERTVKWQGAMSYFLRLTLAKHEYKPIPLNVLIDELRHALKSNNFSQIPQLAISKQIIPSEVYFHL
jgi:hypothetical protein